MLERMRAGDLYRADSPRSPTSRSPPTSGWRRTTRARPATPRRGAGCWRSCSARWGRAPSCARPLHVDYGSNLRIGSGTFANYGLVALDVADITIGDDVQIGPHVQLLTPTHPVEPGPRRDKWEAAKPITIGDNVWLGGGVIVLPGVTIGADTVVGAGAVVTRDLPSGVLAVGNPAKVIGTIGEQT